MGYNGICILYLPGGMLYTMIEWTSIVNWFAEHGWRILIILVIFGVLYLLMRRLVPVAVGRTLKHAMKHKPKTAIKKRTDTLSSVFIKLGLVVTGIIVIFTILAELNINVAPALAGLGIGGIAIGFGAQSLVKDLFNGMLILLENQYGVGDVVTLAGVTGVVEEVDLRRTVLRDLDGIAHNIPNGAITVASNYTKEWSRLNMNISVSYNDDLRKAIRVINKVGKDLAEDPEWGPKIIKAPEVLRVDSFDDSGIAIKILGETKPMEQWAIMGELRLRLKETFDKEGIEIPWPHIKLYLGDAPVHKLIDSLQSNRTALLKSGSAKKDSPK